MPAATYGQFNPGGVDPWAIESTLAPLAVSGNKAEAQMMLGEYQAQRQAASNVYGQAMDQQHEFAKQQLANQLYEARLKAIPDLLGKPGGAQLIGAGGIPGMDLGSDPEAIARVQAAGLAHEQSTNLAEAGKGIEGASAGGLQIAPEGVAGLQGLNVTNLGTNARVQAELIRQQTELQKAAMKAKHGGGGGDGTPGSMTISNLQTPYGPGASVTKGKHESIGQFYTRLERDFGLKPTDAPPASTPPPNVGATPAPTSMAQTDPGGAQATPAPAPTERVPGLRPASGNRPNTNSAAGVAAAQQTALAKEGALMRQATPRQQQAYLEAKAANGGKPRVIPNPRGGPDIYLDKHGRPI